MKPVDVQCFRTYSKKNRSDINQIDSTKNTNRNKIQVCERL